MTVQHVQWNHIGPRVGGFSYALTNKTVLQGGFAQNYPQRRRL